MYEEVARLIANSDVTFSEPGNGLRDEVISRSEAALGFRFPDSFRWWLSEYGGGQIGGDIVYGIDEGDLGRPDIVMLYRNNIEDDLFNENQLVFSIGNEETFYFQLDRRVGSECEVMLRDFDQSEDISYAKNFADFLVRRIGEVCRIG